jgi:hypothetical protein
MIVTTSAFFALVVTATATNAADLSTQHKKELSVFGMRAMGIKVR